MQFSNEEVKLAPTVNNAIKHLSGGKWLWEPKVGDFYELQGIVHLVTDPLVSLETSRKAWAKYGIKPIPLLHWEDDIEPILEGLGYGLRIGRDAVVIENGFAASVFNARAHGIGEGPTRQLATMHAVIRLAKKVGK